MPVTKLTTFLCVEPDDRLALTGVYELVCLANGKRYIGSAARSFWNRYKQHTHLLRKGTHHCLHLQRAWNQHGHDVFIFIIVEVIEPRQCYAREQYYIDLFQTANNEYGYNQSPTAGSSLGVKRTEEALARKRAYLARPEVKEKHRERAREAHARPEVKEKIVAAAKAQWADPEIRAKQQAAVKAAHNRLEIRRKHAEAIYRRMLSVKSRKPMPGQVGFNFED